MALRSQDQNAKTNFNNTAQNVELDVSQASVARIEFSGTYAFTGTFETSSDGTNWFPALGTMTNAATTAVAHSTANATQAYTVDVRGCNKVRVRISAFTSAGTHRVNITAA